jgi:hypothetical protein
MLQPVFETDQVRGTLAAEGLVLPAVQRTPTLKNTILVADLGGERELLFRYARYRVPPVPFALGSILQSLYRRLQQLPVDLEAGELTAQAAMREHRGLARRAVDIFPRLVRPRGRLHRLLWHVLPNPFRAASRQEVWELLGFFLASQMTSSVHEVATTRRPPSRTRRSTSSIS